MWKKLFDKKKMELKKMKFSFQAIKEMLNMKDKKFDKKIAAFLEQCSLVDYIEVSLKFANVYNNFEEFINQIQGKGFQRDRFYNFKCMSFKNSVFY